MFVCSTKIQFCPLISQLKILSPTVGGGDGAVHAWTIFLNHSPDLSLTLN